jgi:anti-anti-sigma factor
MEISTDSNGPVTIVVLQGRLTGDHGPATADKLMALFAEPDHKVIIDLAKVERIDSAGLGSLVSLKCRSNMVKGKMVVARPSIWVNEVIEVTQLNRFLHIVPTMEMAHSAANAE